VGAAARKPSGPEWVTAFPGSKEPSACRQPFADHLQAFLDALEQAGANVRISATLRPPERAYLMHWSWKIARNIVDARNVPAMAGVDIAWVHTNNGGQPDLVKSRSAASQMVTAFGIVAAPALQSRHTEGRAVDMTIGWSGALAIADQGGGLRNITSTPRDGMNTELALCGRSYGVIKAVFAGDPPHWSEDGH
jgi:D-alanyl-D-alanine dipeptidase